MTTLNLLKLSFSCEIASWEIPAFRRALVDHFGWHPSPESSRCTYPLFQCKTYHNEGRQQALVVCMDKLAEEAVARIGDLDGTLYLPGGHHVELALTACRPYTFPLRMDRQRAYHLFNYQALNQDNYQQYQKLIHPDCQKVFLETRLLHHLQIFASSINWLLEAPINLRITRLRKTKLISSDHIKAQCFDLDFSCNLFLPEFIGLGRGVGTGFGTVRRDASVRNRIR